MALPVLCALLIATLPVGAEVSTHTDPESGLRGWHLQDGSISVELIQRLPDQTRAFFQGRGFEREAANAFAAGCVFQSIVKHTAESGRVEYDVADWRVIQGDTRRPLPSKRDWQQRWEKLKLSQAARLAFQWATLPDHQIFEPGDYNWGMTSYGLADGSQFDLELHWRQDGQAREGLISGLVCARDRDL